MNHGYIKVFRRFQEWYGYSSAKRVHLWIELLLCASHADYSTLFNGNPIVLNPGQLITGRKKLADKLKMSESYIEKLLKEFEKQGQLCQQKTNTSRLITILTWDKYQSSDNGEDNKKTTERTTKRQQKDTIQEYKEEKNIKNVYMTFTPPSLDDVKNYCKERKNKVDPEKFIDFYESKGWMVGKNKMKSWKASVRTWEKSEKEEEKRDNYAGFKELT